MSLQGRGGRSPSHHTDPRPCSVTLGQSLQAGWPCGRVPCGGFTTMSSSVPPGCSFTAPRVPTAGSSFPSPLAPPWAPLHGLQLLPRAALGGALQGLWLIQASFIAALWGMPRAKAEADSGVHLPLPARQNQEATQNLHLCCSCSPCDCHPYVFLTQCSLVASTNGLTANQRM